MASDEVIPDDPCQVEKPWFCYVLHSCNIKKTYVGVTVNLKKRIRQHNGEIKGGARATCGSRPWQYWCIMGPFKKKTALQLEWRLHRRTTYKKSVLERRMCQLISAFAMDRWTKTCPVVSSIGFWMTGYGEYHDDYKQTDLVQATCEILRSCESDVILQNDQYNIYPVQNEELVLFKNKSYIIKSIDCDTPLNDHMDLVPGKITYYHGGDDQTTMNISINGSILFCELTK